MSKLRRTVASGALAALLAGPSLSPARAGTVQINPVLVEINAARRTGLITLRNVEKDPITMRAHVLDWSQATGEDSYTDNPADMILSPPVFTIPGGGTQIVRIGPRRPLGAAHAYRLIIEEVPEARRTPGIQVALRLNLPLLVMIAPGKREDVAWSAVREGDGKVRVEAANRGGGYVRIDRASVRAATGLAPGDNVVLGTVLPNATRRWTLPASAIADAAALRQITRGPGGASPAAQRRP